MQLSRNDEYEGGWAHVATELKRTARIRRGCHSDLSWPSFKPLNSNDIHILPHAVSMNVATAKILQQLLLSQALFSRLGQPKLFASDHLLQS